MAGWTCPRCGASVDDVWVKCATCGTSRGSVVFPPPMQGPVKPQWPPPTALAADAPQSEGAGWGSLGFILLAGLLAIGAASSWFFSANRSETGEIARSGDLDATELRVGDCFDFKDPDADEFDQVTARPCSEEHEYELFFVGTMPDGPYPSDAAFDAWVTSACDPAFATYVGRSFESSRLELSWVPPTSEGWAEGDHLVQCLLNDPQQPRLSTSLKGSDL